MVKQQINIIIKNLYFKLLINNITVFIFEKFFFKKIESNIKADIFFLHSLIKKAFDIKKVNATNDDKNISAIIFLVTKNREDCQFWYNQRKSEKKDIYSWYTQSKTNIVNKFSFDKDSNKDYDSSDSSSYLDMIGKGYNNCHLK